MYKHINKYITTQLNRQIHTLNKPIYRNTLTHFNNNSVYSNLGFQFRVCRFLHQIIDDTNYKWDTKYIKNNLKDLDKNLEWLRSLNSLERYIGDEQEPGSFEDAKDILVKLDVFKHVDKIEGGYNKDILNNYLESKYKLLETIIPLLPNTNVEFRKKYILTNQFIQYLYRLISSNIEDINIKILIKYFKFLLDIGINDLNELLQRIYLGIYNKLEEEKEIIEEDKIDTRIKLLNKIIVKQNIDFYIDGIKIQIQELLTDCLCNSRVFYNNINETLQIIQNIYLYCVNKGELVGYINMKSELNSIMCTDDDSGRYDSITHGHENINLRFVNNYMEIYLDKLNNYIYMLDNNTLINILYVFYKINYMDNNLFNKIIESFIFKFDTMDYEQIESLLLMLSTYKYYYMLNGIDLGDNLYGEGGKMLIGMIREYFENKLMNLQLNKMLDPLISLTNISKKNKILKPIILKKLDDNLMDRLDIGEFNKILRLFSNLKIDKANEEVSLLIDKYVNNKLMIDINKDINKIENISKDKDTDTNRLISYEMENMLKQLSRFIPKKKYNRFIRNYVQKYLSISDNYNNMKSELNSIMCTDYDIRPIISLLKICVENKLYKFDNNEIINKLLSRFISSIFITSNRSNVSNNKSTDVINKITTNNITNYNNNNLTNIEDNKYINNNKYKTLNNHLDMDDMIILLESVDHSNLSMNNVYLISDVIFNNIYEKIKKSNKLNLKHIYRIMNFMINTRVIDEKIMNYLLEYVYDYYILTIPEIPKIEEAVYNDNDSDLIIKNELVESNDGVLSKLSSIMSTDDEDLYKNSFRNNFKVGLYILYLKCIKILRFKNTDEDDEEFKELLDNTYRYIVNHFNYSHNEYYLSNKNGKKIVENFKELLLFEEKNDYKYYRILVKQMTSGVKEYLTDFSDIFKINSGKIYSKILEKLDNTYNNYYEIEGIRYDFYSEENNEAIHILKKEHYYVKDGDNEIHLKNKGELMKMISEKINIKLKLIPEHTIFEENNKNK